MKRILLFIVELAAAAFVVGFLYVSIWFVCALNDHCYYQNVGHDQYTSELISTPYRLQNLNSFDA
jgi:hypothetical protein